MIFRLVLNSLKNSKARFACATAGIAIATLAVVFTSSLVATNNAQAPILAERATSPWAAWRLQGVQNPRRAPSQATASRGKDNRPKNLNHAVKPDLELEAINLSIDYRPGGHVLQGPPMMALLASAPVENPYAGLSLTEGRWVDVNSSEREIVCVKKAMRRFGAQAPALGVELKFIGKSGTMSAKIVGYLEGDIKLPREFPTVFANPAALDGLAKEEKGRFSLYLEMPQGEIEGLLTKSSPETIAAYKQDEQRRMDYATPLLIIAAILTALSLLVNSLLLSVESNRKELSFLRLAGMTKTGIVKFVFLESFLESICGFVFGVLSGFAVLHVWVMTNPSSFPGGAVFDFAKVALVGSLIPVLVFCALFLVLSSALRVGPLDHLRKNTPARRKGMVVTFALGFAAFVAVEVWGESLMRAFIPSEEWPDAIVSILPSGASSFEIEKLRDIEGVERISELLALQLYLAGEKAPAEAKGPRAYRPNILLLASEWLPEFRFIEGDYESAVREITENGAVVITQMSSRARNLHKGDELKLEIGAGRNIEEAALPIAGVVDLNWHMVTSRGLLRGMNRMPVMTDGPAFLSFDTLESLDSRPAAIVRMTHLWLDYKKEYLENHGVFQAGRNVEAEIARRLDDPTLSTVRLHARDEIADGTLAHGTDLIGDAARVPFFFLAILAIGFIAMLVAEAESRKMELAMLRADRKSVV